MPVIYNSAVKNNRLSQVVNAIDAGAGVGLLNIGTAGMSTMLAQIPLVKPSFSILAGVMTMLGIPVSTPSALATGNAASATFSDSLGNVVVTGLTVGTANADIILNSIDIQVNQEVRVTAGAITHA